MRISDWSSDVCSSDLHAHDLAGESAIDRKVIGGDLDVRGVADLDEGDVARGDARFDEQFVAERHDLHDLFARIHIAAQGVDEQIVDDAARRRADFGAREPAFGAADRLLIDRHFSPQLAARSEEHTYELQSLLRISSAVFCLKKKKKNN